MVCKSLTQCDHYGDVNPPTLPHVCVCACTDKRHLQYAPFQQHIRDYNTMRCKCKSPICVGGQSIALPCLYSRKALMQKGFFFPEPLNNRKQSDFEFASEYAARQLRVEANQLQFS